MELTSLQLVESQKPPVELCSNGPRNEQLILEFGAPIVRIVFMSNELYDAFGFEASFQFLYNSRMNSSYVLIIDWFNYL